MPKKACLNSGRSMTCCTLAASTFVGSLLCCALPPCCATAVPEKAATSRAPAICLRIYVPVSNAIVQEFSTALQIRLSRNENDLARGLSSGQRPMCVRGAHERKLRADLHLQFALRNPGEELGRPLDQLLARRDIIVERWPREKE